MARYNKVQLFGVVSKNPEWLKETSELKLTIQTTIGRKYSVLDGTYADQYEYVKVLCSNKIIAKEMATWSPNDFVAIDGVISTRYDKYTVVCPECGCSVESEDLLVYVRPIFGRRLSHLEEDNIENELRIYSHVSNRAQFIGHLASDPKLVSVKPKSLDGMPISVCQYQIALNRLYRVPEDPEDRKADFPYVKSYSDAMEDAGRLKKGSLVFIDGYLQVRNFQKRVKCPFCGAEIVYQGKATEIVPYQTEYLEGFRSSEEKNALFEQRRLQAEYDRSRKGSEKI